PTNAAMTARTRCINASTIAATRIHRRFASIFATTYPITTAIGATVARKIKEKTQRSAELNV
ncbi:MAG TPA: hypothetical protein VF721_20880, partial [Pyrinomonadaceae bacterium]